MERDFDGRVAVVLGGSGGFGRPLCSCLAQRGAAVASLSRTETPEVGLSAALVGQPEE